MWQRQVLDSFLWISCKHFWFSPTCVLRSLLQLPLVLPLGWEWALTGAAGQNSDLCCYLGTSSIQCCFFPGWMKHSETHSLSLLIGLSLLPDAGVEAVQCSYAAGPHGTTALGAPSGKEMWQTELSMEGRRITRPLAVSGLCFSLRAAPSLGTCSATCLCSSLKKWGSSACPASLFPFCSHKIQHLLFTAVTCFKITDMLVRKVIIRSYLWKEDKISCRRDLLLANE